MTTPKLLLCANDFERLWGFSARLMYQGIYQPGSTATVRDQYRVLAPAGPHGGCNYRASPLRPPWRDDPGAAAVTLPVKMPTIPSTLRYKDNVVTPPPAPAGGSANTFPICSCIVSLAPALDRTNT